VLLKRAKALYALGGYADANAIVERQKKSLMNGRGI
jgi:hypothetical protein